MALVKREDPHHLHSDDGKPAMAGGEPSSTANADMAFPTTIFQTKSTRMTSKTMRTR
jgi:hypothetical protein